MSRIAVLIVVLCLALAASGKNQAKKSTAKKAAPKTAVSGQTTSPKSATAKKSTRKRSTARARARRPRQGWRYGQMQPTPERYREIQQALVDKGYTTETPDGQWDTNWQTSLKRFQQDQNLQPNGKLNSLSLMALGLGPRRETAALEATAPATEDPAAPADQPNRGPQ